MNSCLQTSHSFPSPHHSPSQIPLSSPHHQHFPPIRHGRVVKFGLGRNRHIQNLLSRLARIVIEEQIQILTQTSNERIDVVWILEQICSRGTVGVDEPELALKTDLVADETAESGADALCEEQALHVEFL